MGPMIDTLMREFEWICQKCLNRFACCSYQSTIDDKIRRICASCYNNIVWSAQAMRQSGMPFRDSPDFHDRVEYVESLDPYIRTNPISPYWPEWWEAERLRRMDPNWDSDLY